MPAPPAQMAIRQVYAYCRFADGSILVQLDGDRPNLPGGKPEPSDSDEIATLRRECLEESQVEVAGEIYLGYVEVDDGGGAYAQLRYLADVTRALPQQPDPSTGRVYERAHIPIDELAQTLGWGPHGDAQVATLRNVLGVHGGP